MNNAKSKAIPPSKRVMMAYKQILNLGHESVDQIGVTIPIPTFPKSFLIDLCHETIPVLQKSNTLVELEAPMYVFGDIHGNIFDLLRLLIHSQPPPKSKLLFLGDYVDRGEYSVEVITLLFALYCTYPDYVTLLRGNHEFSQVNHSYGFYDDVIRQYGYIDLYKEFDLVFQWLPIAAVVSKTIFAVHGGLSPDLNDIQQLNNLPRPMESYGNDIVLDIVWSDPAHGEKDYERNARGSGVEFSEIAIRKFLKNTNLKHIVRGHQCVQLGVAKFDGDRLYTVFSCSNYEDMDQNRAGIMFIAPTKEIQIFSLPAIDIVQRDKCLFMRGGDIAAENSQKMNSINLKIVEMRASASQSYFCRSNIRKYFSPQNKTHGSIPCAQPPRSSSFSNLPELITTGSI